MAPGMPLRLPNGHRGSGRPGTRARTRDSRRGRSARLKCSAATRWLSRQQLLVRRPQPLPPGAPDRRRRTSGSRRPPAPRRPGTRPTASGRRWVADSTDGLPKPSQDDGSRTASQAAYASAMEQPPSGWPSTTRAARPADEPVELGPVAVLGRPEQPVGAADGLGQRDGPRDVLAGERPRRLQQHRVPSLAPRRGSDRRPVARCRVGVERVVDRRGAHAAGGQLGRG